MQWVANHLFAPNEDGCQTVIHAATDAWEPAPQPSDIKQQNPMLRVSSLVSSRHAVSHAFRDKLHLPSYCTHKWCVSFMYWKDR